MAGLRARNSFKCSQWKSSTAAALDKQPNLLSLKLNKTSWAPLSSRNCKNCLFLFQGFALYSGATSRRHMSMEWPATLLFLLSTSKSTMKPCTSSSIFISPFRNLRNLFIAADIPSVVWLEQNNCPAFLSKIRCQTLAHLTELSGCHLTLTSCSER